MKVYKLIYLSLIIFAAYSCKDMAGVEKDLTSIDVSDSDYYLDNGILNVKNVQIFKKLAIENSKKTAKELVAWQDSVGFNCFQSFYNDIFEEYENIVDGENPIEHLEEFKVKYEDYITIPGGTIEGLPDYTIKPKLDMQYASVANLEGKVIIAGEEIDAKNIMQLKSTQANCFKRTDKRKMWISVVYDPSETDIIYQVEVSHKKKITFAWVSYKTEYYWELENPANTVYYTPQGVSSNTIIWMPAQGTDYLRMWNGSVKEYNACTFVTPIIYP